MYLGIGGTPCAKCGSNATTEYSKPTSGGHPEREIILKCLQCQYEQSHGIYTLVGKALVKVR